MKQEQQWFFSWVAYDLITGEQLQFFSGGEVYVSDPGMNAHHIFENLMNEKESLRENLKIHCIAFNRL
ncbi:hypothetical protein ACMSZP_000264 [Cronobacter turicensis]